MSLGTYELLDSGKGRKLERVGDFLIERSCAIAYWQPHLDSAEWKKAQAIHHRSEKGGGHWEIKAKIPESWMIEYGGLQLLCKLTAFGHLGFFAEQKSEWDWLRQSVLSWTKLKNSPPKILNLFAYTGASSLALAQAGAEVTHLDAAKGVVDWCRSNQEKNPLTKNKIRFIVEDCLRFLQREVRRENLYDGVVLDPPSFGRGPNKETFKLEEDVLELLSAIRQVLKPEAFLIHFSCHTPGFSPEVLKHLISDSFHCPETSLEAGEMLINENSRKRSVPAGSFCRYSLPLKNSNENLSEKPNR